MASSPYVLGNHKCMAYKNLRIWAETGLIKIVDTRDEAYQAISVRDFLLRMQTVSEMLRVTKRRPMSAADMDERACDVKFLEDGIEVVREARSQGTPDNPEARRAYVRARKTQILMPNGRPAEVVGEGTASQADRPVKTGVWD